MDCFVRCKTDGKPIKGRRVSAVDENVDIMIVGNDDVVGYSWIIA